MIEIVIDGKEYKEIQILTKDNELLVSITDENIIEKDGYKVVSVPGGVTIDELLEDEKKKKNELNI